MRVFTHLDLGASLLGNEGKGTRGLSESRVSFSSHLISSTSGILHLVKAGREGGRKKKIIYFFGGRS